MNFLTFYFVIDKDKGVDNMTGLEDKIIEKDSKFVEVRECVVKGKDPIFISIPVGMLGSGEVRIKDKEGKTLIIITGFET